MTVYVDQERVYMQQAQPGARHVFGSGRASCHMMCDGDLAELHTLAQAIGLRREWFQDKRSFPHYDLTPSKRRLALRWGAIEIDTVDYIRMMRAKTSDTIKLAGPNDANDQG